MVKVSEQDRRKWARNAFEYKCDGSNYSPKIIALCSLIHYGPTHHVTLILPSTYIQIPTQSGRSMSGKGHDSC